METIYKKEKLTAFEKISGDLLNKTDINIGRAGDDFEKDLLTVQIQSYIYTRLAGEKELTYTFSKPTFREWLFKKYRTVKIKIVVKDLLHCSRQPEDTTRINEINILN